MKLLCICSALDIRYRLGCTPHWWQFFKGLYELGHDVIAIPYMGAAFETPWWRTYPNPCQVESQAFQKVKQWFGGGPTSPEEGLGGKVTKAVIESWLRPRWEGQIASILEKEKDIGAVLVMSVPMNHLTGVATRLRSRCGAPFFYFDGDVPVSLPRFGGFSSGFRIYENADLSEYDGIMCNSEGGAQELLSLGARRVQAVHWGVDPELYTPIETEQDRDVFFYGLGSEYRKEWIDAMLVQPSRALSEHTFAAGGRDLGKDLGNVKEVGDVPFSMFRWACCRSRINLNISRNAHASVFGSSTARLFELACLGCCIVTNPYNGVETWFEPGKDIVVVDSAEHAIETYRALLADTEKRRAMGRSARAAVLERHTHRHRAAEIVSFVSSA